MAYETTQIAEIEYLEKKVESGQLPQDLREKIDLMIKRIRRMARQGKSSNEYEEVAHYIDWCLAIPWGKYIDDNLNLMNAKAMMDRFHHGREDIKQTLIEYISVLYLKKSRNASNAVRTPVLCFTGDQGTGKTTMAKAVAAALGRPFYRIALGAVGSASTLRGKAMSRYDAFPGQIVKGLVLSKCMNPVILLDEFDKVSGDLSKLNDFMAIFLEVLDPQQNYAFRDQYIDYPIDLSQVFFITTANSLKPVSSALLDRLEVVHFADYTREEKVIIAKQYLFPRVLEKNALTPHEMKVSDDVWPEIVNRGTLGPGVRSLEKSIERIARKVAFNIVTGKERVINVTLNNINDYLKKKKYKIPRYDNKPAAAPNSIIAKTA